MKWIFFKMALEFMVVFLCIIIVSCLPILFQTASLPLFLNQIMNSFYFLVHPEEITLPMYTSKEIPLFNVLGPKYVNSLVLLLCAFGVSLFISTFFGIIYISVSSRLKRVLNSLVSILETMPDVLMLILSQIFFIWLFKQTGILVNVFFIGDDITQFLIPILCLSLIPTLHLFRFFVASMEEEQHRDYYYYAKSKGLNYWYILIIHLLRNIAYNFISHSKTILLFMLSSLLMLEIIFNINGMMDFIKVYGIGDYRILVWCLILLYLPIIFILRLNEWVIKKLTGQLG